MRLFTKHQSTARVLTAAAGAMFSVNALALIFSDGFESLPPCALTVSDDIIEDTTWSNGPSACDILIVPRNLDDPIAPGFAPVSVVNATLTIEPGTVVQFAQNGSISVAEGGGLQASGSEENRITFAARQPVAGFGRGLFFGFDALDSRIEYSDFINLGSESALSAHDAAIAAAPSSGAGLILRYSTISGSSTIGVELDEFTLQDFEANRFFANEQFGLRVSGPQVPMLDEASDYAGGSQPNSQPFVLVEGVSSRDRITADGLWRSLNAPYFLDVALNVESGTLSLAAGVQIVAGAGATLRISELAALTAVGTTNQPISFRGLVSMPGYWEGIVFFESDSPNNRFENVTVQHAGQESSDAAIDLDIDALLFLRNSTISNNSGAGVCVGFRSTLDDGGGNSFSDNAGGNIVTNC
ncbi:MAG: hypothetical protein AB8B96_14665 [Lysobacterales bacterium]